MFQTLNLIIDMFVIYEKIDHKAISHHLKFIPKVTFDTSIWPNVFNKNFIAELSNYIQIFLSCQKISYNYYVHYCQL